jgi:hypothetical protein
MLFSRQITFQLRRMLDPVVLPSHQYTICVRQLALVCRCFASAMSRWRGQVACDAVVGGDAHVGAPHRVVSSRTPQAHSSLGRRRRRGSGGSN